MPRQQLHILAEQTEAGYVLVEGGIRVFPTTKSAQKWVSEEIEKTPERFNGKTFALLTAHATFKVEVRPRSVLDVHFS